MNCVNHPNEKAVGTCMGCGKFYCEGCLTAYRGKSYCSKCIANQANAEPAKNKITAGLLALLLGGLGAHKFYLGKPVQGVLYILFCWAFIPSILALVEGIMYLTSSDEEFAIKYGRK